MPDAHDFDFEFGTWSTELRLLPAPLTGSTQWIEGRGTTLVHPIWDGRANLVELTADMPIGRVEALSLRLFDAATGQWSINVATARAGAMSPPLIGAMNDGRGEFLGHETMDGRDVVVRFLIAYDGGDTIHFEQAFSVDAGATWETNLVATDTRVPDED